MCWRCDRGVQGGGGSVSRIISSPFLFLLLTDGLTDEVRRESPRTVNCCLLILVGSHWSLGSAHTDPPLLRSLCSSKLRRGHFSHPFKDLADGSVKNSSAAPSRHLPYLPASLITLVVTKSTGSLFQTHKACPGKLPNTLCNLYYFILDISPINVSWR